MIERERKFRLKYLPEGLTPIHIKQAYLMFDKKKQFRVRIIDDKEAYVAYKVKIDKTTKSEYEYEIDLINIPDYCGEEITGNKDWSNLNIAKKNRIQARKINKN
jgi:hypothetical protein